MPDLMETYSENRWLVQPNHANNLRTTHGGNVLEWMDELGALSAMGFSGENCVTARIDQVNSRSGDRIATTESYSVYVAVVDGGDPTPVPELTVESERGRELREQARSDHDDR